MRSQDIPTSKRSLSSAVRYRGKVDQGPCLMLGYVVCLVPPYAPEKTRGRVYQVKMCGIAVATHHSGGFPDDNHGMEEQALQQ